MAREARKTSSKGMYAIRLCGECLIRSEADRQKFSELSEKYFAEGKVYGCAITKTEIRMVVKEAPEGISATMKPLITSYARYFNKTYKLEGKLFSDRFKSEPIESEAQKKEAIAALSETGTVKPRPPRKTGDAKPKAAKPKKTEKPADTPKRPANRNVMPSYLL